MIELKSSETTFCSGSHVLAGQSPKGWYFFLRKARIITLTRCWAWRNGSCPVCTVSPECRLASGSEPHRPKNWDQMTRQWQVCNQNHQFGNSSPPFQQTPTLWSEIFHQEVKPWTECGDNLMRKELLCLVLGYLGLNIGTGEWIQVRNVLSCPKNNIFVQTSLDSQTWQNAEGKCY